MKQNRVDSNTANGRAELKKSLNFKDVLILAFSTMIGWGWVSLTGTWSSEGGALGASLAFFLGAVLCIFVGLTYCELTPMLPYAGGEIVFSYKAMGYHASWFTGWMIAFAYVGVAAWEGPALATAIDYLIPIPRIGYLYTIAGFDVYLSWLAIPAVAGMVLMYINFKGVNVSAVFQTVVTAVLALGGVIFVVVSALKGDIRNTEPVFTGTQGVFTVVLSVPAMFVGFDIIPQAAEEMNLPLKKIPKAIISSIFLAAMWYILMIVAASYAAPKSVLGSGGLTVANAINYAAGGQIWGRLIIITAIMGILTSWNGFIIGATRVLYAMGRAKMLPEVFGTLHPKYKTPFFSTIFIGAVTILTPLLGKNSLGWFVDASSFGTVIAYFMVALSFLILRYNSPEMDRPFKIKYGKAIGFVAIAVAVFFISLYLPIGASSLGTIEWVIVSVWSGLGLILYLFSLKNKDKNKQQREAALFRKE